eukprot:GHVH01016775.1.p1 GENE.GHVH01016775.1~~GHVH01016775.1.p1  ORF type:complete len:368 (+),score=18.58 GHVH01016775.1:166-1104(+)
MTDTTNNASPTTSTTRYISPTTNTSNNASPRTDTTRNTSPTTATTPTTDTTVYPSPTTTTQYSDLKLPSSPASESTGASPSRSVRVAVEKLESSLNAKIPSRRLSILVGNPRHLSSLVEEPSSATPPHSLHLTSTSRAPLGVTPPRSPRRIPRGCSEAPPALDSPRSWMPSRSPRSSDVELQPIESPSTQKRSTPVVLGRVDPPIPPPLKESLGSDSTSPRPKSMGGFVRSTSIALPRLRLSSPCGRSNGSSIKLSHRTHDEPHGAETPRLSAAPSVAVRQFRRPLEDSQGESMDLGSDSSSTLQLSLDSSR